MDSSVAFLTALDNSLWADKWVLSR